MQKLSLSVVKPYLGTNWLAGRLGLYSGWTMNNMWGKPVPKYAPSV